MSPMLIRPLRPAGSLHELAALRYRDARHGDAEVGNVQWTGQCYRSVLLSQTLETLT